MQNKTAQTIRLFGRLFFCIKQLFYNVLVYRYRQVRSIAGNGEDNLSLGVQFCQALYHVSKAFIVFFYITNLADFEGTVDKQVGDVIVACQKSCQETVQTSKALNVVLFAVDQANGVWQFANQFFAFSTQTTLPLDSSAAFFAISMRVLVLPVPLVPTISLII